jgi:hypothetical protein
MAGAGDPVGSGFVASLARPGGDRPGVRVIAAAHGVSVNTVQRVARAQ